MPETQSAEIIAWLGEPIMVPRDNEAMAIEANRQASIALARMDAHVIECSGRYHETRQAIQDVRDSVVRLHERMDHNFATRQEQFDRVRRDSRMIFVMMSIAIGGWALTFALHFWH